MLSRFYFVMICALVFGLIDVADLRGAEELRPWSYRAGGTVCIGRFVEFKPNNRVVVFEQANGKRVEAGLSELTEADRKLVELKLEQKKVPPTPPTSVPASMPAAADALVQIFSRRGQSHDTGSGIVFHVDGEQAFVYDMNGIGKGADELVAIAPRRDTARRTQLKFYRAVTINNGNMTTACSILVGPKAELPEPIKLSAAVVVPRDDRKVLVAADSRPADTASPRTVQRLVLPGTTVLRGVSGVEPGDLSSPSSANWGSVRFSTTEQINHGLVLDETGTPLYLIGWGSGRLISPGVRQCPLTPVGLLSDLKLGGVIGFQMGETTGTDGKPRITVDWAMTPLPGAAEKLIVKAAELPQGDDLEGRFAALSKQFESADPPKLTEVGELRRSDVDPIAFRRGPAARAQPNGTNPEVYSLSIAAPQTYLDGQPVLLLVYIRNEAGQDEVCRSFGLPALPKKFQEALPK